MKPSAVVYKAISLLVLGTSIHCDLTTTKDENQQHICPLESSETGDDSLLAKELNQEDPATENLEVLPKKEGLSTNEYEDYLHSLATQIQSNSCNLMHNEKFALERIVTRELNWLEENRGWVDQDFSERRRRISRRGHRCTDVTTFVLIANINGEISGETKHVGVDNDPELWSPTEFEEVRQHKAEREENERNEIKQSKAKILFDTYMSSVETEINNIDLLGKQVNDHLKSSIEKHINYTKDYINWLEIYYENRVDEIEEQRRQLVAFVERIYTKFKLDEHTDKVIVVDANGKPVIVFHTEDFTTLTGPSLSDKFHHYLDSTLKTSRYAVRAVGNLLFCLGFVVCFLLSGHQIYKFAETLGEMYEEHMNDEQYFRQRQRSWGIRTVLFQSFLFIVYLVCMLASLGQIYNLGIKKK